MWFGSHEDGESPELIGHYFLDFVIGFAKLIKSGGILITNIDQNLIFQQRKWILKFKKILVHDIIQ